MKEGQKKINKRTLLLYLIDVSSFLGSLFAAILFAMQNGDVDGELAGPLAIYLAVFLVSIAVSRMVFRIYANMWRYAQADVYMKMVVADVCAGLLAVAVCLFAAPEVKLYIGALTMLIFILVSLLGRFVYRLVFQLQESHPDNKKINVAIVGAGKTGVMLANELRMNDKTAYRPCCFIDTDNYKAGSHISGIRIYPEDDNIFDILERLEIKEIFIAIPTLGNEQMSKIHRFYFSAGYKIKIYDLPITQLQDGEDEKVSAKRRLREFKIEDLLFRDTVKLDNTENARYYGGKTVLVTGGGGSIGSELCRQIAKFSPKKLVILDIYENNAYDIQQELMRKHADKLCLEVEIATVRDRDRLESVFAEHRPDVVFHAAAHKHVPLMEKSSCEAIKNNVLGTYNVADMAEKYGAEKFILISTDKAVNPTNVMGASKRLCEMVVQCRTDSKTSFAAVRFGNVLGSNGSVIPLFGKQIEKGGPVTITDKRIIRYFMTIPEASQLVIEAGSMARNGELFVLNMGKPVKILDLAENMIRLSGLEPYVDIDIVEIGLRPGEKLYEELLMKNEALRSTRNKDIFIECDAPLTREDVDKKIEVLMRAVERMHKEGDGNAVKAAIKETVPTFKDPDQLNSSASDSEEMKMAGVFNN